MLTVKDLKFSVGEVGILHGLSFDIAKGETVGVIGPNGSGKTTLFNCLSGFALPTAGAISFAGRNITHEPAHSRALLGLGRVFQNFGIFKDMSLEENMLTALEGRDSLLSSFWPWSKRIGERSALAKEQLAEVGLDKKFKQKASSLSGGQMRLLEIVRTLSFGAELFLLDEPTAGVSPKMKDDVANLILKLQSLGKTVLIIEHDINFIQKFCKRIIVLDQGKVVIDDTPEKVRANKLLQEIYFGSH